MLSLDTAPDQEQLRQVVSNELADFRIWYEKASFEEVGGSPHPVIRQALPRWIIPRGSDWSEKPLADALEHGNRWHLQIFSRPDARHPKYYCRARFKGSLWRVSWFGYRWSKPVHQGIQWINKNAEDFDGPVGLVSSSLFKFTSFWLLESDQHFVVSSSKNFLPRRTLISGAKLQGELVDHFGEDYARGGVSRED